MRIYRWWWMLRLRNPAVKLNACAWPLIVCFAVNNVVPLRAGDALRVVGFTEQLGTPAVWLLGSLLIERILDLTILLVFFLAGIAILSGDGNPVPYLRTAVVVGALGILAWALLLSMGDRLERLLLKACNAKPIVSRGWAPVLKTHGQQLFMALNIVRSPGRALRLLAMTVVVWTFEGLIFTAVASSLHYEGRTYGPWFALATGSLSTMVPSSPGYVGTFDFFTISALTAFGADPSLAAATAFIVHAVLWLPLTCAGFIYFAVSSLGGQGLNFAERFARAQEKM